MDDIKVKLHKGVGESLLAYASVVINDSIKINGIKLIQAKTKMYIIFPSSLKGKKRYDITYPVTEEMRLNIFNAILKEYEKQN